MSKNKTVNLNIRVTEDEFNRLSKFAELLNINNSSAVRKMIKEYIESYNQQWEFNKTLQMREAIEKKEDIVKQPSHYIGEQGLEVEEVLRNFLPRYVDPYVAHRIGSAIEYLLRAPLKNGKQDLEKAKYNIEQALESMNE